MQAQLLPIFLLAMPLALCFICIWGSGAKGHALAPVRSLVRPQRHR
jgi:hypothetical protein